MHNIQNKIVNFLLWLLSLSFFFFAFSIALQSCSAEIVNPFEEFYVTDFSYTQDFIKIKFSSPTNPSHFFNAVTFLEDEEKIDVTISINSEKEFTITPISKITKNHTYKFLISVEAESLQGKSLSKNYEKIFTTYEIDFEEIESPKIIDCYKYDDCIKFYFSAEIQKETFDKSFSVEPNIKNLKIWNKKNNCVEVKYLEPLTSNTTYFYKISTSLKNIFNKSLETEFSTEYKFNHTEEITTFKIFAVDQKNNKTLLEKNLMNLNVNRDSEFEIIFSKNVDIDSLKANIKFEPQINFEVQTNQLKKDSAKIILQKLPDFNSSYKMIVATNLKDCDNNKIAEQNYSICFNNESTKNVNYLYTILEKSDEAIFLTDSASIIFNSDDYPPQTSSTENLKEIKVAFFFELSKNATKILDQSFMENFSIKTKNNCITLLTKKIEIISKENFSTNSEFSKMKNSLFEKIPQTEFENKNISIAILNIQVQNTINLGQVNFDISKNLSDDLENKLEKDINLQFFKL